MTIDLTGGSTAEAGNDATLCSDATHTITGVNATGYNTLVWTHDGAGTLDDTDPFNPIYTPTAADGGNTVTLDLLADAEDPCTDSIDQVQLTIIPPPTVSSPSNGITCQSAPYTITNATATDYSSLLWIHDGSGTLDDPTALLPTYTPTPADGGNTVNLTLTAYPNSPCTEVTSQMTIDVSATAMANAGDDSDVCIGESHPISSVGASGYTTINWTHDGLGTLDQTDPLNPIYTPDPTEAGNLVTLTLTVEAPAPCVGTSDQVELNIIPGPTVEAGSDATICEGQTYTVNDADATNYSTILWTTNGLGTIQDAATLTPTYTPSVAETGQTITMTLSVVPNAPCITPITDEMDITIISPPTADAGGLGTVCVNQTYTVSGAAVANNSAVNWTHDGQGTLSGQTTLTPTYTPDPADEGFTVKLTLTAIGNTPCGDDTDVTAIRIVGPPTVDAGTPVTICYGSPHQLTGTSANTAYTEWTHDGNGTLDDINNLTTNYTPATSDQGNTITFTLTGYPMTPCSVPATATVTLDVVAPPQANAGTDNEICANGGTFTINQATAANYGTITWTVVQGNPTHLTDGTTLTPSYTPTLNEGGTQVILAIAASPNTPCTEPARDTMILDVGVVPEFTVTDGEVCPDETITMDIVPINQYDTDMVYDWYTDSIGGTLEHVGENYTTPPLQQSVTYWVQPSRGCVGPRVRVDLIVHPLPIAEFTADPDEIENVTTDIQFTDLSTDLTNGTWDFGDLTTEDYTQGTHPLHTYTIETGLVPESYTITLTGTSQFGCPAEAELVIPVELRWAIFIPKAFTPGDKNGVNDDFIPKGYGIVEMEMWIFNRWGDNIYQSKDWTPWDGYDHMYQGGNNQLTSPGLVKQDTYVYKVEIINVFGEKHTYIGEVNLIR